MHPDRGLTASSNASSDTTTPFTRNDSGRKRERNDGSICDSRVLSLLRDEASRVVAGGSDDEVGVAGTGSSRGVILGEREWVAAEMFGALADVLLLVGGRKSLSSTNR